MTLYKRAKYICINIKDIPDEIIREYNLKNKSTSDVAVYIEENQGMYGLPQSGNPRQPDAQKNPQQARLLSKQVVIRFMETKLANSAIYAGRERFWSQIQ